MECEHGGGCASVVVGEDPYVSDCERAAIVARVLFFTHRGGICHTDHTGHTVDITGHTDLLSTGGEIPWRTDHRGRRLQSMTVIVTVAAYSVDCDRGCGTEH